MNMMILIMILGVTLFLFSGCEKQSSTPDETSEQDPSTLQIVTIHGEESTALFNLTKGILREKMNMKVQSSNEDVDQAFSGVANKNYDILLDAWLPLINQSYLEQYGDQLDQLGTIFTGGRIGLVVPEYVNIDSIEELKDVRDKFNSKIYALNTDRGVLDRAKKLISAYELDFKVLPESPQVIIEHLENAIENGEWIVITGFSPHWKFNEWNLKFLQDSKGIWGEEENIAILARKGLKEDNPTVAKFFSNFSLKDEQLEQLIKEIHLSNKDPYDVAIQWINANPEVVNKWIPG